MSRDRSPRVIRALLRVIAPAVFVVLALTALQHGSRGDEKSAVDPRRPYSVDLPEGPGREQVQQSCLICHSAMLVVQQHKDSTAWEKTITQMLAWGAPMDSAGHEQARAYLVAHFGPAPKPGQTPAGNR
jgi:cytochrome c5